jgi:hypothetical protein
MQTIVCENRTVWYFVPMAIYHLSVKTFKRSSGQSATAAAAYRSGQEIRDERTGEIHDYRKKEGIESSEIIAPARAPGWATDREQLWNKAEESERRKNAVVAREFEIALPSELTKEQRRELAVKFAKELVERHGFAADICIHKPSREGDQRNHHAHILVTTRRIGPEGFTEKTRELDERINRGPKEFEHWRERFAKLTNEALEKHRHQERVDHRTLKAQGIERAPTQHLGPRATAIERKAGQLSRVTQERDLQEQRLEQARLDQERQQQEKAAEEKAREQAIKEQEAAEKRRVAAPRAPEPSRMPPRAVAWKGPSSKPVLPKPPSALDDIERKAKEQAPAPQLRQEEPPKPQEAPPKKENSIAAMRERAAQLRQKEPEKAPTPQQEPAKQPAIDKEQLRRQMQERAAQLKQQQQPAPQIQEKTKPKDKDRGPER